MMSETTVRIQTYVVIGVMIGCFSMLYPRIFHPIVLKILGLSPKHATSNDEANTPHHKYTHGSQRPHPSMRHLESSVSTTPSKRGGIMTVVLPIYGIGVILYLLYTLTKIYGSKRRRDKKKRDVYLRQYYRDFHYDVRRGKFRMGHGSSEEDGDELDEPYSSNSGENRSPGNFDWPRAYSGSEAGKHGCGNIYRSAESLPRDLEQFLAEMNNPDMVSGHDLSALRSRLETTEREMTALLRALDSYEQVNRLSGDSVGCPDGGNELVT